MIKNKKTFYVILFFVLVIVGGGILAWQYYLGAPKEYQEVTIREIISDIDLFDGKKVIVQGEYYVQAHDAWPGVECEPASVGETIIKEEYLPCRCRWGVVDQNQRLGTEIIAKNNAIVSNPPNYQKGELIELRGIIRATTVQGDPCNLDILYRSAYLEVKPEDIDIDLKPSPEFPPETEIKNICENKCNLEGFSAGQCGCSSCLKEETALEFLSDEELIEIQEGCGPLPETEPVLPCLWVCCCKSAEQPPSKSETSEEKYCENDADCACGRHIITNECFSGNKNYVDTSNPCPDYCYSIAGKELIIKCVNNECKEIDYAQ